MKLYDVIVTQKRVGVVSVWVEDDTLTADVLAEGQRYAAALAKEDKLSFDYEPDDVVAEEATEGDDVPRSDFEFNLAYPKEEA